MPCLTGVTDEVVVYIGLSEPSSLISIASHSKSRACCCYSLPTDLSLDYTDLGNYNFFCDLL